MTQQLSASRIVAEIERAGYRPDTHDEFLPTAFPGLCARVSGSHLGLAIERQLRVRAGGAQICVR
jgi:hypothetical protein